MKIDIICPLYNAEKDIERLHRGILKQKNVEINNIKYILIKMNTIHFPCHNLHFL